MGGRPMLVRMRFKSARGHIWKAKQHKGLQRDFWAYQFVFHFLSEKTVFQMIFRMQAISN
jgi:hypothetical protein